MAPIPDLRESILAAWRTNNRVSIELVAQLPDALWKLPVPGAPRRTVRMLAGHFHNSRSGGIRTPGSPPGIRVPPRFAMNRVTRRQLVSALAKGGRGMEALLELGIAAGGEVPA